MPNSDQPTATNWDALRDPETARLVTRAPMDALWTTTAVELQEGQLVFDWTDFNALRGRSAPDYLLERFLALRTDREILAFGRRFGPLRLLEGEGRVAVTTEPITLWRKFQNEFAHLLAIAAALREVEPLPRASFEFFEKADESVRGGGSLGDVLGPSIVQKWDRASLRERRYAATSLIQARTSRYIDWCGLRPALVLTPKGSGTAAELVFQDRDFRTGFHPGKGVSLFGALLVQLLAALTVRGFATCSACGSIFVLRQRQPASGKNRFCLDCGRRAAVRLAKARYRQKTRKMRRAKQVARGGAELAGARF